MPHPNVLFFDLDDTLVVETASAEKSLLEAAALARDQYGIDPDALQKTVRIKARELWYQLPTIEYALRIGVSSWEGLWADLSGPENNADLKELRAFAPEYRARSWSNALKDFKISDESLALEMSEKFQSVRHGRHFVYPETVEVLESCAENFRLGMITNGAPGIQWEKINASGVRKYFEHIVVSGDVGVGKPDPEIFHIAMKRFGMRPGNCLVIGDSLRSDITGAKNAGIRSVWVRRDNPVLSVSSVPDPSKAPHPDHTVRDLRELLPLLPGLFR